MTINIKDPYTVGEAIAAQVVQLAQVQDNAEPSAIIGNIANSARRVLEAGRKALEGGDTDGALYAIACAHGACSLISGLSQSPDDEFLRLMAQPFAGGEQ